MPASPARVSLVTQDYRWDLQVRPAALALVPGAREEEAGSYCSTAEGAAAVNAAILDLLSSSTGLVEVDVNPLPPNLSFERYAPTARLEYAPLGISRDVLIVGVRSTVRADGVEKGSLVLW